MKEAERLTKSIEIRYDGELTQLNDNLTRKANTEDIQYYRKELAFKLDKNELEAFRQEYVERLTSFDFKLNEKNNLFQ